MYNAQNIKILILMSYAYVRHALKLSGHYGILVAVIIIIIITEKFTSRDS